MCTLNTQKKKDIQMQLISLGVSLDYKTPNKYIIHQAKFNF